MEKKEREQLKERLLKMVVNEPRPESMPPITMAEVMVNSMSKPNLEPLLDFVEQELSKAREEGMLKLTHDILDGKIVGLVDNNGKLFKVVLKEDKSSIDS